MGQHEPTQHRQATSREFKSMSGYAGNTADVPWWKEPTKDQWYAYCAAWLGWPRDAIRLGGRSAGAPGTFDDLHSLVFHLQFPRGLLAQLYLPVRYPFAVGHL